MIFSFYPTKPVGSCDGGMVVSDDKDTIDWYRMMTLNGMHFSENNWDRKHVAAGYKMHATSIQAYLANENLKKLDKKNERLGEISVVYNGAFGYNNTSRHLYRVRVSNNKKFIEDNQISMVFNCTSTYKFSEYAGVQNIRIPLSDNLYHNLDQLRIHKNKILTSIDDALDSHNVLICCYDGKTLSPFLISLYLMKYGDIPKDKVKQIILSKNTNISMDYDISLLDL